MPKQNSNIQSKNNKQLVLIIRITSIIIITIILGIYVINYILTPSCNPGECWHTGNFIGRLFESIFYFLLIIIGTITSIMYFILEYNNTKNKK